MSGRLRDSDPTRIGPYRLLGRLGAGGMGVVYLGRSTGGRHVAVKTIHAQHADDEDFRQRFRREVTLARSVTSRWVTPVLDADTEEATPWLATSYVTGPSVQDAVQACGTLPPPTVAHLAATLAEALTEIHAAGLVHRDVKPSNVLLALDGPRLIDFGIARAVAETGLTTGGYIVGSPGYLSPEQVLGPHVGPASDLFSLGAVLAHAFTGEPPFGRGTAEGLMYKAVHEEPDLGLVPAAWRPLLAACLAKEPQRRPTAAELRTAVTKRGLPGEEEWLPAEITRLIATRSSALLDIDNETTVVSGGDPTAESSHTPSRTESAQGTGTAQDQPSLTEPVQPPVARRRLLAVTGTASVLALGGGYGLWAALRDSSKSGAPSTSSRRTRYVIGLHADLTGPGAALGTAQERGARLAVEEINASTSVPFELELRALDDKGRTSGARDVAARFTADPDVMAVIGPSSDATALDSAAAYAQEELATLVISAGAGELSQRNPRSLVRATPDDYAQAKAIVAWLVQKAKSRGVALIDDRSTYGWGITRTVKEALKGEVETRSWIVPVGTTDYRPTAAEVLADGADAVVYAGAHPDAARLARELTRSGFTGTRIATSHVHHPGFPEQAGASAEGWLLTSFITDPAGAPALASFTKAHRLRYQAAPAPYAAEAFDAVHLIKAALTGRSRDLIERTTMIRLLRATSYQGATKKLTFQQSDGEFTGQGTFMYRVEDDGRLRWLGNAADLVSI